MSQHERDAEIERMVDEVFDGPAQDAGDDTPVEATVVEEPVDELTAARADAAQYLDDLKRLKAEFENFRKRMVREQTLVVERASASVVERLLPVLDNFDLALIAAGSTNDYEAMVRGVELVYSELRDTLRKEGLERMDTVGEAFDPERHEAVLHDDGDEVVVDEMRPGYLFGGRVLRPAMVKVGAKRTT